MQTNKEYKETCISNSFSFISTNLLIGIQGNPEEKKKIIKFSMDISRGLLYPGICAGFTFQGQNLSLEGGWIGGIYSSQKMENSLFGSITLYQKPSYENSYYLAYIYQRCSVVKTEQNTEIKWFGWSSLMLGYKLVINNPKSLSLILYWEKSDPIYKIDIRKGITKFLTN